jgi:restriction system protein
MTIWQILKSFWVVWVFIGVIVAVRIIFDALLPNLVDYFREIRDRRKRLRKLGTEKQWLSDRELLWMLRGMGPDDFENYIADLFEKMGYKTIVTGGAYDEGVDVVAEKDGVKYYIQCKKYFGKHEVGVAEVRDFYGAIADHLARGKGYFITTNKFTLEAERFAEDKPIELVDSFRLVDYIHSAEGQTKIK